MKNTLTLRMKNALLASILLLVLTVFASCGGDDDGDTPTPQQPTITSVEPSKGKAGDAVTIKGTNFSTTASDNVVNFNGVAASVTSATATEIKTTVPATATTGKVTVSIEGLQDAVSTTDFAVFSCDDLTLTLVSGGYSISAEATGGEAPYQFALGDGSFQSESTFDVEATDHTVKVKDANNCEATATITAAELKTITDTRDDQVYKVVKIGDQVWLGENFNLNTNTADSTSSWCPDDVSTNCSTYGRLYTWHVASQMAPEGWKLPSQADWETLFVELGGTATAGDALVDEPFNALEAGYRDEGGSFAGPGTFGDFWASTTNELNEGEAVYFELNSPSIDVYNGKKEVAFSVRLVKN